MSDSQNDLRRQALKRGLDQLSDHQLHRLWSYIEGGGALCLDGGNYDPDREVFCPLGVAVGVNLLEWGPYTEPRSDLVSAILTVLGYVVSNTRGVEGHFYRSNRMTDLRAVVMELRNERAAAEAAYEAAEEAALSAAMRR